MLTIDFIGRPIVFHVIPVILVTIITIALIVKLRYINRHRAQMTRSQQQKNNTTCVLIVVLIVFVICSLPWPISALTFLINPDSIVAVVFNGLMLFFQMINSSVNVLIYTALSKQYRAAVAKMHCCSCLLISSEAAKVCLSWRQNNTHIEVASQSSRYLMWNCHETQTNLIMCGSHCESHYEVTKVHNSLIWACVS